MMTVLLNSKLTKVLVAAFCVFFLLRGVFLTQRAHASELLTRLHGRSRQRVVDDRSLASIRNETLGVSILPL